MRRPIFPGSRITWAYLICFLLVWITTWVIRDQVKHDTASSMNYGRFILSSLVGVGLFVMVSFAASRLRKRP